MHQNDRTRKTSPWPKSVRLPRCVHRSKGGGRLAPTVGLGLLALLVLSLAAPASLAASPARPTVSELQPASPTGLPPCNSSGEETVGANTPCGTWAWGAAANLTAGLEFEGAYNASQYLTGGGLTAQGAYIDLEASLSVEWAAYAIVNVSTPSPGALYVTFQAGDLIDLDLSAAAQGDFPLAGTYGPTSNITFQEMNASVVLHERLVDRYQAFLNFSTDSNGSMALENEHLQMFRTLNVALTAVNFPNITYDPSTGDSVVSYTTGQIQGEAQVAVDISASFQPALLVVQGPVYVGESWTASSQASVTGEVAWSVQLSGIAPDGTPFNYSGTGQGNAAANFPVVLAFQVVGERTLYFPNGGSETDYVIDCQSMTGGGSGIELYDGLLAIPNSVSSQTGGVASAVSAHPAAAQVSSSTSTPTSGLYSHQRKMTDASDATPVSGQTVTASPMTPARAQDLIDSLGGLSPAGLLAHSDVGLEVILVTGIAVVALVVGREVRRRRRNHAW
jgi:hypothetical protein